MLNASLISLLVVTAGNVDLSPLSPAQRQAFEHIAREEFCGCDSALTLAGCLELRPDCRIGQHLGKTVIRGLQQGSSSDALLAALSQTVLAPFCSRPQALSLQGAPTRGPDQAPLVLVEFADFRCGHCKHASKYVKEALKRHGKRVRFVFVPFPLQDHPESMTAAEALLAGAAQGKFIDMHDALFSHSGPYTIDALKPVAARAGLDVARFERELHSAAHRPTVQALKQAGMQAGVQGTPAFFVNGRRFDLDPPLFTFSHRFEMELDRNQGTCQ